jgi:hypothetical protein
MDLTKSKQPLIQAAFQYLNHVVNYLRFSCLPKWLHTYYYHNKINLHVLVYVDFDIIFQLTHSGISAAQLAEKSMQTIIMMDGLPKTHYFCRFVDVFSDNEPIMEF